MNAYSATVHLYMTLDVVQEIILRILSFLLGRIGLESIRTKGRLIQLSRREFTLTLCVLM
jgi:hypothetical protein